MRKLQKISSLALVVAGTVLLAPAQRPGMAPQPRLVLQALDLDKNGVLSADEIAAAPKNLLKLDRNGDGKITAGEVMPRVESAPSPDDLAARLMEFDKTHKGYLTAADLPERMQGIFARGNANHDGRLTADELQKLGAQQSTPEGPAARGGRTGAGPFRFDPLLAALDLNHDGELSPEEIAAAATSLLVLDKNGNGQLEADELKMRQMSPAERLNHFMEEFDGNKDGKIARDEAPEHMPASEFDAIDSNHDGFLDKDELAAFFARQASQPAAHGPEGTPQH